MERTKQWSATLLAREACKADDVEAFAKAMAQGADLRDTTLGCSVWDLAIAHGAIRCFSQILPAINVVSGPEATVVEQFMSGQNIIGNSGMGMGVGANPANALFADVCRKEWRRQKAAMAAFSVLAEQSALAQSAPVGFAKPGKPRSAL